MKVIFLHDVQRVGKKYDVKEVSDGYAQNFLFPRGLAKIATSKDIKNLATRQNQIIVEREVQENLLLKNLKELQGKTITVQEKANEKGHLFSAIHKKDIINAMKSIHGAQIGEEFIVLQKPIKEIGEFEIPVKIGAKESSFKLEVKALD